VTAAAPTARAWLVASLAILASARPATAQCPDGTPPPCGRAAAARAAAPVRGSVAVLPFANRSADSADAFLAEELPEQISGLLSRVPQLHVTSATAVAAQWRRTPDALAAARALRVEWFVSGSLRRVGRQVSANIELVRTATAEQAWASPFQRSDGDLAAIEAQVAESVAVAVGGRLAPAQVALLQHRPTRNPEAYRLYLYSRSLTARRTANDIESAVRALLDAVRLDPGFAAAWAGLSFSRSLQALYGNPEGLGRDSVVALARSAAERALALDSTVADAWLASGLLHVLTGDPGGAWTALSRAQRLDSLNAEIENSLGYLYSGDVLGLPEEAEPHFRRALQLNPDMRNAWRLLGLTYLARNRTADALACLDSALAHGPWAVGLMDRAWVRYERGDLTGALADAAAADSVGAGTLPPFGAALPVPVIARRPLYALARGDSAAALALLAGRGEETSDLVSRVLVAFVLGRREDAIAALQRLRSLPDPHEPQCAAATPCSTSLRTWRALGVPLLAPLRSDPRIGRLLEETRPRVPWLPGRR